MMGFTGLLCALLVCVASVGSTDVEDGWQVVTENWYVVRIGGATAGVLQVSSEQDNDHIVSSFFFPFPSPPFFLF